MMPERVQITEASRGQFEITTFTRALPTGRLEQETTTTDPVFFSFQEELSKLRAAGYAIRKAGRFSTEAYLPTHSGDPIPMTNQTPKPAPTTPDRMTPEEIRAAFAAIEKAQAETAANVAAILDAMRELSRPLATLPEPTPAAGDVEIADIESIVLSYDDDGKPTYKAKGPRFAKFGVRIWPETISKICDPAQLKPGTNELPAPLAVRVLMGENTLKDGTKAHGPKKILGKA